MSVRLTIPLVTSAVFFVFSLEVCHSRAFISRKHAIFLDPGPAFAMSYVGWSLANRWWLVWLPESVRGGNSVASACRGGNSKGNALPLGCITAVLGVIFFTYPGFSGVRNRKKRHSIDSSSRFWSWHPFCLIGRVQEDCVDAINLNFEQSY